MKLLVVEDERRMLELLHKGLSEEGHSVSCAADGSSGLQMIRNSHFDIVILDVMMPNMDGFGVAKTLRSESNYTPIVMLTAKDTVSDAVLGLDLGADDYVTKPFSFSELLLRLQAVKRRSCGPRGARIQVGDVVIDLSTREAYCKLKRVALTRTEYGLLDLLMRNSGRVVSRGALISSLGRDVSSNTLDAFVRLIRMKVSDTEHGRRRLIHNVRGVGYVIRSDGQ